MNKMEQHVSEEQVGVRLDKVLSLSQTGYSRQQIQEWIKAQAVLVNGGKTKANYRCKLEDIITVTIPVVEELAIEAEDIPLDIVYEDDDLLVINKVKGMLVHPTHTVKSHTLVNGLLHHCKTLSDLSGEERPGIVHRLDKDTSGLLVVAKNNDTHDNLKEQFKARTVKRVYEAIVHGNVAHEVGIVKAPIGRDPNNRLRMAVTDTGKYAETNFTVLQSFNQYTHVQCQLKTGRTHQIRVHMKYMNHPIVGDAIYTRKKSNIAPSQVLFARELGFIHPRTGEALRFAAEQPTYFAKIVERLKKIT